MNRGRVGGNTFVCSHPHPPSIQNKGAAMMMAAMLAKPKFVQRCENFTVPVYAVCLLTSQSLTQPGDVTSLRRLFAPGVGF
jgi:hypothetical protein